MKDMSQKSGGSHASRNLVIVLICALGLGALALPPAGEAAAPAEGRLSIVTDPAGASVFVDGESKGMTPLRIAQVAAGDHRVTLAKEGYLENSRVVRVEAGHTRELEVRLTSSEGAARSAAQITPAGGGGGVPTWVWIAAAAGGGTAAYFLLRDTNEGPTVPTISLNPSVGLQALTSFSMSAGSTDPDGDPLSFSWDFGDSTTGNGQNINHVYNSAGTFTVRVTVSDGEFSESSTVTATVRGLSGTWSGNLDGVQTAFFTWTLSQVGASVSGTYSDALNGSGPVTGGVSAPNNVSLVNDLPCCRPGNWRGTLDGQFNRIDGTTDWFGGTRTFYLIRR
jgi:hypothetical protein